MELGFQALCLESGFEGQCLWLGFQALCLESGFEGQCLKLILASGSILLVNEYSCNAIGIGGGVVIGGRAGVPTLGSVPGIAPALAIHLEKAHSTA